MADDFGSHGARHGGRLAQIQGLGRRGGLRFVDVQEEGAEAGSVGAPRRLHAEPGPYLPPRDLPMPKYEFQEASAGVTSAAMGIVELAALGGRVKAERLPSPESNRIRKSGDFVNQGAPEKNKGGRPGLGKPWEALGISRAEYFRRKKGGGG